MTTAKGSVRPFKGAEYLESVRDGREIYIYGERVTDVTTHPAFRNTVRMITRLYDALHSTSERRGCDATSIDLYAARAAMLPWTASS